MPHVYILHSNSDHGFYVGSTRDLNQRLKRHVEGRVPSTKNRRPLTLVHSKLFEVYSEAYKYEQFIKGQKSSEFISKLITEK